MSTRRGAAALLALVVLSSCGIPVEDRARPISPDDIPSSIPAPAPATTAPAGDPTPASVELFFVQGSRLGAVRREAPVALSAERTIAEIARGPTAAERGQGFRTALPRDLRLAGTVAAAVPLIEVSESFARVEGEEQILALAQLVFTLTGLPGVEGVSFALAGRPVEVPTGDGVLKRGPLRRADFQAVAPLD